jgi:endonuclease YncB( thermonuclease family)
VDRLAHPVLPGISFGVHDGDTATVLVQVATQPERLWLEVDGRLDGYNARELKQPGGPEALTHLAEIIPPCTCPRLPTTLLGSDKYGGRTLVRIGLPDGRDVTGVMIGDGYGAAWNGQGPKPNPPWPIPASVQVMLERARLKGFE